MIVLNENIFLGACVCDDGWAGIDCSMRDDEPPTVNPVATCNPATQDCTTITIDGSKFVDSPQLTCHFIELFVCA